MIFLELRHEALQREEIILVAGRLDRIFHVSLGHLRCLAGRQCIRQTREANRGSPLQRVFVHRRQFRRREPQHFRVLRLHGDLVRLERSGKRFIQK